MIESKNVYCVLLVFTMVTCTSAQTNGTVCPCLVDMECVALDTAIQVFKDTASGFKEARQTSLDAAAKFDKEAADLLAQGETEAAAQAQNGANLYRRQAAVLRATAIDLRAKALAARVACKGTSCCSSCCSSFPTNIEAIFDPEQYSDPTATVMAAPRQCSV